MKTCYAIFKTSISEFNVRLRNQATNFQHIPNEQLEFSNPMKKITWIHLQPFEELIFRDAAYD